MGFRKSSGLGETETSLWTNLLTPHLIQNLSFRPHGLGVFLNRNSLVIYYCNQNSGGEKGNKLAWLFAVSKASGRVCHKGLFNKTCSYRWDVKRFYRFQAKRHETKQEDKWLLFSLVKAQQQLLLKPVSDLAFLPEFVNIPPPHPHPKQQKQKSSSQKDGNFCTSFRLSKSRQSQDRLHSMVTGWLHHQLDSALVNLVLN